MFLEWENVYVFVLLIGEKMHNNSERFLVFVFAIVLLPRSGACPDGMET